MLDKNDLMTLLRLRSLPVRELATRERKLAARVDELRRGMRRAEIDTALADAAPEVRAHVATLDLTRVAPRLLSARVRDALVRSNLPAEVMRRAIDRLAPVSGAPDAGASPDDGGDDAGETDDTDDTDADDDATSDAYTVEADPDLAPLLDRARLFELGTLAAVGDDVIELLAPVAPRPAAVSDSVLSHLVADRRLTEAQARSLGLGATLYEIADGDAGLAAAIQAHRFGRLGNRPAASTRELARIRAEDWEGVFAGNIRPPGGGAVTDVARAIADRFAALHPGTALLGRLPRPTPDHVTALSTTLDAVPASTGGVVGAEFERLDTAGRPVAEVARLRAAHAELAGFARAYPALDLASLLDDRARPAAERAATALRRADLLGRLAGELGDVDVLELDYSPRSPDRARLPFARLGASDVEARMIVESLKGYQRLYAVTGHVDDTSRMLAARFRGARDLARPSAAELAAMTGLPLARADRHGRSARKIVRESSALVGALLDFHSGLQNRIRVIAFPPDVRDFLRELPGLDDLFGGLAYCSCTHCRSVLGPAAYFVDLMYFVEINIRNRNEGLKGHVIDLRTRRPDLWQLALTCENTDTRVPTLEIVNEVLERYVVRGPAGVGSERADFAAIAYRERLPNAVNSFQQPFHLALTEIQAYLVALGSSRAAVARAIGAAPTPTAAAELELSAREVMLVTRPETTLADLATLYDVPLRRTQGVVDELDAQAVLRATGLGRTELAELIATRFVRASGASPTITTRKRDAESIQNDMETLGGLSEAALDRMHRFARLWRRTGWTIDELDHVLTALGGGNLDERALTRVATVRDVQRRLAISVDETCALFGAIPDELFASVFDPADVPPRSPFAAPTVRLVLPFFGPASAPVDRDLSRVLAGLGLAIDEIGALVRHLSPFLADSRPPLGLGIPPVIGPVLPNLGTFNPFTANHGFLLDAGNLSLLYRHTRLARQLRVTIDQLFELIRFADIGDRVRDLDGLVDLLDLHAWWRESAYTLVGIATITSAPSLDGTDAPAMRVIAGAAEALLFRDTIFAVALGITERASRELLMAHDDVVELTPDGRWRVAVGVDLAAATLRVPDGIAPEHVRAILERYQIPAVLAVGIGAELGMSRGKLEALARYAGVSLRDDALAMALAGGDRAALRRLIAALRPLAMAFADPVWDDHAVDFVREHVALFDAAARLTLGSLRALTAFAGIARRREGRDAREQLHAVLESFDATARAFPSAGASTLSQVIGAPAEILVGLVEGIALPAVSARALEALDRAAALSRELGIDGGTLVAASRDVDAELVRVADALRAAVRRRHPDAAERSEYLEQLDQPLRERRRDALVAYLLHSITPRPFDSAEDLYQYFLIDVAAGGCAATSRLVEAISAVQLYVQRVLMSLEQTRTGAPHSLAVEIAETPASEWSWRKNYRVWEANRKIFLWPENYIEPDLRDDKSPLFEELERELLQTDLTDQNVVDAYTKYLTGLEELVSLRLAGAYHEMRVDALPEEPKDILHLFGVALGDPPTLFYRTGEDVQASLDEDEPRTELWHPWRKVETQIGARFVAPVVHEGRLHVVWTGLATRPLSKLVKEKTEFSGYQHTMTMSFTTLRPDGTWTPAQSLRLDERESTFSLGRGVIDDPVEKGKKTLNLTSYHDEPKDTYTLDAFGWQWLWVGPAVGEGAAKLRVRFRNFRHVGRINLFTRKVAYKETPLADFYREGRFLRALFTDDDILYATTPWLAGSQQPASMANLLLHRGRVTHFDREQPGYAAKIDATVKVPLAALPRPRQVIAVPGASENVLLQHAHDLVLIQAHGEGDYVARRIGTTLVAELSRRLFVGGIDALLARDSQELREAASPLRPPADGERVELDHRIDEAPIDFDGPYGVYYRELFFHVPFLIANALNARGRFKDSQHWYRYIFDPTATDGVWRCAELAQLGRESLHDALLNEDALAAYHQQAGNPHAIARIRRSAYQRSIVTKYIDNLLDWADHLFGRYTPESVNEALLLYVEAQDILGPRPPQRGACGEDITRLRTYDSIRPAIDQKGEEVLIEVETMIAGRRATKRRATDRKPTATTFGVDERRLARARERAPLVAPVRPPGGRGPIDPIDPPRDDGGAFRGLGFKTVRTGTWSPGLGGSSTRRGSRGLDRGGSYPGRLEEGRMANVGTSLISQLSPVFCVPVNEELVGYWDRVEDRLYKIRHCLDLDGQARELALFAPEIDPHLLVRLRAEGLSLEEVLDATSGSLPAYRFQFLIDRAKAYAASLSSFGVALLASLEKKDGEELNRMRLMHQQNLGALATQQRRWDVQIAEQSLESLTRQKAALEYRRDYYKGLVEQNRNGWEVAQSTARHAVSGIQLAAAAWNFNAAILHWAPQIGSPFAMKYGGVELGSSSTAAGYAFGATAAGLEAVAASAGLEGSFDRRSDGWNHQYEQAKHELKVLDRQIKAAGYRVDIALRALEVHQRSLEQFEQILELTDGKFTNLGLYTWLSTELRGLYRDAYQNALALARLAERAYRFERGDETSRGLTPNPWDATRAGLLAGERLLRDLENLERRFLETNFRTLEVDQPFALSQIAPTALLELRETGRCTFTVAEPFFDAFYPGQFRRRIRAVRLTIPCITGPFVNVGATLTLTGSRIRMKADAVMPVEVPPRRSVSVATSTGQSDGGVFELSFRDERYMPFEGAGAISDWELRLPGAVKPFDYGTINDVILSISYNAEQDGKLRDELERNDGARLLAQLSAAGLHRVISLRHEFSRAFSRLVNAPLETRASFEITKQHFPPFVRDRALTIARAVLLVRVPRGTDVSRLALAVDGSPLGALTVHADAGGLPGAELSPALRDALITSPHDLAVTNAGALAPQPPIPPGDTSEVDHERLLDVLLFLSYIAR